MRTLAISGTRLKAFNETGARAKGVSWSHPPGSNWRPADYETTHSAETVDNWRLGPRHRAPETGTAALVEQVSEQVTNRSSTVANISGLNRSTRLIQDTSKATGFSNSSKKTVVGFAKADELLKLSHPELLISKQKLRQAEAIQLVRLNREREAPNLGFASRPFVLCGLPIKRPAKGALLHERRNGQFLLQVTGHPKYGVPWGQDRLVPIFLATLAVRQRQQTITFRSAAEMLDTFGMQQGGSQYRRLVAAFQRIFGATIFFGTDTQTERALVTHQARFNFMREARIWYSRDPNQSLLPGGFENEIVLSDEFFPEVTTHSIPTDLEAAKAAILCPLSVGSVHVALVSLFHIQTARTHSDLRRVRFSSSAWQRRLCEAAEVSRATRTMAGSGTRLVAKLPGADWQRW